MSNFKRGLFLGGLLGLGAMWLGTTKKGRQIREDMFDHAATIYAQLREQVMATDAWEAFDHNQYTNMVRDAVDTYAVKTGLTDTMKRLIERALAGQWKAFAAEIKKQTKRKHA